MVATHGWQEESGQTLWDVAARYPAARHLLLTDIGRDGMLQGPNHELLAEAVERLPSLAIQASGGVTSLEDLASLSTDGRDPRPGDVGRPPRPCGGDPCLPLGSFPASTSPMGAW